METCIYIVGDHHIPPALLDVAPLGVSSFLRRWHSWHNKVLTWENRGLTQTLPAVHILTSRWHKTLHTCPLKTPQPYVGRCDAISARCHSTLTGRPLDSLINKVQASLERSHSLSGQTNSPALRTEGTLIVDVTNEFLKVKHTRWDQRLCSH